MNNPILIPEFLDFVKFIGDGEEGFGCVAYCPAHMHSPGDDVPCSSSWLIVF